MGETDRLRALDLRTEDVVLIRLLVGVGLRVLGGLLLIDAMGDVVMQSGVVMVSRFWTAAPAELLLFFGHPCVRGAAGVLLVVKAGFFAGRLVPHTITTPRCPACRYALTSLADGRCSECGYAVSPLRDGPLTAWQRLLLGRAIIMAGLRLLGAGLVAYGVGRFVLQGVSDLLLEAPTFGEQYRIDRGMVWSVILIVGGLGIYTLAERIAPMAMFGLRRASVPSQDG